MVTSLRGRSVDDELFFWWVNFGAKNYGNRSEYFQCWADCWVVIALGGRDGTISE